MALSPSRHIPYEAKTTLINIYSYEDKNIRGSIRNTSLSEDLAFSNLGEFIFEIEKILNNLDFPQAAFEMRTINNHKDNMDYQFTAALDNEHKPIARFRLQVIYRHNSSWQGNLVHIDENKQVNFRSLLELIYLFDNVLA